MIIKLFGWEWRKNATLWYWLSLVAVSALGSLIGVSQYTAYRDEFEAQGVTYLAVWGQSALLLTTLFLPILAGAFQAQKMATEQLGRNIARLKVIGAVRLYSLTSALYAFVVSLISMGVIYLFHLGAGLFLGFDLAEAFELVPRLAVMALALTAWQLVVASSGVRLSGFSSIMTFVLVACLLGFALAMIAPPLALIYPPSLLAFASSVRAITSFFSLGSLLATGVVCLGWLVLGVALIRAQFKRAKL